MSLTKNTIIVLLLILVLLLWTRPDTMEVEDQDLVTIEYQCSAIEQYENVPPEVLQECRIRNQKPSLGKKTV